MALRTATWLLLIAGTAWFVPVAAQDPAPPPERANGNGKPASAEIYQDRLIDGGRLEPDIWNGDVPERDAGGWPRGLRLDGIYSTASRAGESVTRYGLGIGAFLSTPQHGAWTFDGLFGSADNTTIATLWQRDLPFDGGWRASNGAGNLNSPVIDLARFQPRWYLPTSPMLGALTEWRDTTGTQITAGAGEPGVFTGVYVPGFRRLGGYLSTVGAQWSLTRNWSGGLQYYGANNVTSPLQPESTANSFSTRSWFGATAWQDSTQRYQLNVLGSDNSFNGSHTGAWADGYLQDGRYGHGFGAFYLGPSLAWGNQLIGSDTRGAYYRINFSSRQWLWDAMIDYAAPVGASAFDATTFVSANTRYQIWQDFAVGGGGNARFDGLTAWSAFAFVESSYPALINRTQLYTARNEPKRETTLTATQTWNMPAGTRLSTSALVGRYEDAKDSSNQFGLALYGGGDIANDLSLDANVQWARSTGDAEPTTLIGNVGLNWRLLPDLQLLVTLYHSQAQFRTPLQIVSPIAGLTVPTGDRVNDRGAFVILRYEARAGRLAAPLGGPVGAGTGSLSGIVFLDQNDDGRMNAGEQGVPNVTVILDGRFSVRTDGQGRFEFPAVVAGRHVVTVAPDNLPLPWMLVNEGRTQVDITVRGTHELEIRAFRPR